MKKPGTRLCVAAYTALLFCFVIPPLTQSAPLTEDGGNLLTLSVGLLFYLMCIVFFIYLARAVSADTQTPKQPPKKRSLFRLSSITALLYGLLICNTLAISAMLSPEAGGTYPPLIMLVSIPASACYEESLYRLLLPAMAERLTERMHLWLRKLIIEVPPILLFALAHRYNGAAAVVHAGIAALILRSGFCSASSLIPPCIAHTLFNLTVYAVLPSP